MADPVKELEQLDPSDSMESTLKAILTVLDMLEESKDAEMIKSALTIIGSKEKEAMDYFLRPLDDDSLYNRLISLHHRMDDEPSVARYRRALDIRQARKWTVLGDSQAVVGNHMKAQRYLKRALFFGPMEEVEGEVRSALERSEKRVQKAQREIERTMEKLGANPKSEKLLKDAASYLIDLDRLDEAAKLNKRLLNMSGSETAYLYQKGCILFSSGDYKKAIKVFQDLSEKNPDSLNVKRCLNWTLQMMDGPRP